MKKNKFCNECDIHILLKTLRIMRITIFLLLASIFQTFASDAYSQKIRISIEATNQKLVKVLDEIENRSEFYFLYNEKLIDTERPVSITVNNRKIDEILDELFAGTDIVYTITDRKIILAPSFLSNENPQQTSVFGKVTSQSGQPLPGVTVVVKGSLDGTISDTNGNYSLSKMPENAILVFSFVGMRTQEVPVSGKANIDIVLVEETIGIEEVVAVGYGTQKKSHLTAAVDQVKGETLENRPLRSLGDGLRGAAAGLNVSMPSGAPEAEPHLNIRGFTGFGQEAQPLILVDGVERDLKDINPLDVESISILKDGSASAIYGSRAPYGIVLITTKSGGKGEPLKLKYSTNQSLGVPFGVPKMLNSWEWAELINEGYRNKPGGKGSAWLSDLQIERMKALAAGDLSNPVFDGLDPAQVPYGTFALKPTLWGGHTEAFANTNWLKEVLKDVAHSQQHNLSVSGGGKQSSYYIGLGYNDNEGIFTGTNFKKRYSTLVKTKTDVNEWMRLNVSVNYVKSDESGPNNRGNGRDYKGIFSQFAKAYSIWPYYNPNGSYYRFNYIPNVQGASGSETVNENDLTVTGGLEIEPVKDLKLRGNYTWRNSQSNYSLTSLQLMQILPNGDEVKNQRSVGNESITKRKSNTNYHSMEFIASYSKTLNSSHNFFGLMGYQEEENMYDMLEGSSQDFFSHSILSISTSMGNFQTTDRLYSWATRGWFGRFSYDYEGKYLAEFNARYDATSRFLREDRWGFFPSASVAWNVAREEFWPVKNYISQFKPRASWSTSGDASVGLYPFYPSINIKTSNKVILDGSLVNYATMPNLVSDQLTWAKPTTIDFGFDLEALKNRLDVNYDWYQRTIKDQFGPPPSVPETIGIALPKKNNAISETRGWEAIVSWRDKAFNVNHKPLNYTIRFNMSDYIGYVVKYEDDGTGSVSGQWTPGQVFGKNYQYVSDGIMQNKEDLYVNVPQGDTWYYPGDLALKDLNGDGEISDGTTGTWYNRGDLVENGYNYPRWVYGLLMGADWNNFDLSVLLEGVGHWKMYSNTNYVFGYEGSDQWGNPYYKEHVKDLGYWKPTNTKAFFPMLTYNTKNRKNPNDQYTLNLAHLRIRNIKLGYNIPKSILHKIKMSSLYLYASAENLGFIYYKSFVKMEPDLLSADQGRGYPPQQYYSFGINVEF